MDEKIRYKLLIIKNKILVIESLAKVLSDIYESQYDYEPLDYSNLIELLFNRIKDLHYKFNIIEKSLDYK